MFFLELNNISKRYVYSVYFTMVVVVAYSIATFFTSLFPCIPVKSAYDLVTPGACIDRAATYKFNAVMGLISDLMTITIPIPMVISLQMSVRKKIGLLALFAIGSV